MCHSPECDHRVRRRAGAERGPIVHELPALLEKVAAPIGGLDRIADSVGKGLLDDMVRVGGRLGGPVSERAAKAMDRYIVCLICCSTSGMAMLPRPAPVRAPMNTCEFPSSR